MATARYGHGPLGERALPGERRRSHAQDIIVLSEGGVIGSVVLITGARTGFGREAAERFARRGHHVFATMRDSNERNAGHREALEQLAAGENLPLEVLDLDVTDDASVQGAVQHALHRAGRLDVVINNAGVAALGVTEAFTPGQFEQMFSVNVSARCAGADACRAHTGAIAKRPVDHDPNRPHTSDRRASTGSMAEARRAGRYVARAATAVSPADAVR